MLELFEDSIKNFDINSKELVNKGYTIFEVEDKEYLSQISKKFAKYLKESHSLNVSDFNQLHQFIDAKTVNEVRLGFFNHINKDGKFALNFMKLAKEKLFNSVGTELAGNKKVNFSIQLPKDKGSKLAIHCDTYSGESEFQINLWVPLTNCYGSNSMFIANPKFSSKINSNLSKYEESGLEGLLTDHKKEFTFLDLKYGEALLFTPTCLHGNIVNKTQTSRISFNCRYKNVFSPYAETEESAKKLGSFYKILTPKPATIIGFRNKINY